MRVRRAPWQTFPDVLIATVEEKQVKTFSEYAAAKSGDGFAAYHLVSAFVRDEFLAKLRRTVFSPARAASGRKLGNLRVAAVHAEEATGRNQIAQALSSLIAAELSLRRESDIVQSNVVSHTGSDGYTRLARQATFEGKIVPGAEYLLVDDFVGQGGTLANFRSHVELHGGHAVGAVVLTGKPYSAKIRLTAGTLRLLRTNHGTSLESWWINHFGFDFSCLTESEARYLAKSPDAFTIRNKVLAAG